MLLAVTGMQAQLNSLLTDASATFTNPADTNIVRNYNDQYAVGYIVDNGTPYFYSAPIDSFSVPSVVPLTAGYKINVPNGIEVSDMKILGENTYFCGKKNFSFGVFGTYGWFKTDELWTSSTVTIHYFTIPPMFNLKKMDIARSLTGMINIVAIGEDNSSPRKSCIIEIPDAIDTLSNALSFASMPSLSQTLNDIHIVNNQVFFVGMDINPSFNTFFIRKSTSFNVLADPSLSQIYYYTPTNNVTVLHYIAPCAEVLSNNQMAVAHQNYFQGVNIAVSYIDLMSMNCVSSHFLSQENRSELHEMKYIVNNDALFLLYNNIGGNSKLLAFHPTQVPPYSSYALRSTQKYTSLDLLNSQSFISSGKNFWYLQRTTFSNPLYPCITSFEVQINQFSYTKAVLNQAITKINNFRYYNNDSQVVYSVTIRVNCQH